MTSHPVVLASPRARCAAACLLACLPAIFKGDWDVKDLRLLSLAKHLPTAFLTTIRRGTWALLEAFLDPAPSPENGYVLDLYMYLF